MCGPGGGRDSSARAAGRPVGPAAVEGGLRAPGRVSAVEWVYRCVRIWSITDAWAMKARIRMVPWHFGHTSGSTSKICRSIAAHRRVASVGAKRGAGMAGRTQQFAQTGRVGTGGLRVAAYAARAVGVPSVVPQSDGHLNGGRFR